jgi:hypothetical protein
MHTIQSTVRNRSVQPSLLPGVLLTAVAILGVACSSSKSESSTQPLGLNGKVSGPSGIAVVGATVYLVPSTAVPTDEITGAGVLAGSTVGFDEPLEDAVASMGPTFTQATTDANGNYSIAVVPDGRFFLYVEPGVGDLEHLPGGTYCRKSESAAAFRASTLDITLTSSPPAGATYIGMTSCLNCHAEYATEKSVAHRLGFRVPGVSSPLQDTSYHPEIDDGLAYFKPGTVYTAGTPVYHYDYDSTRGFDKFKTSLTDPGAGVSAILWLWKDTGTGEHKITIDNVGNVADPRDLETRVARLTYGGAVEKQRYMIEWEDGVVPANDRHGLYPLLQFQTDGSEARYDRTRRVFRDYHLDFYLSNSGTPTDISDDLITVPSITRNISVNCIGCHAAGYTQYTDPDTNEILAHVLKDVGGEYDIDDDGFIDDLNTGCENCHGPGSAHAVQLAPRYILMPEYLSPSRSNQLCGRCHNRQQGADAIGGDHPLDINGNFPLPGISRGEFLASYVKPTAGGPQPGDHWADFAHAKSHHQQYQDIVTSKHYRNPYQLVTCFDCHDMHGGTGHERALIADPHAPDSPLCMNCHGANIPGTSQHTLEKLGVAHGPSVAACVDCHMVKTAKTGSGNYGALLSAPTGTSADVTQVYFENDVSSHVFDVPRKTNVGVAGVRPDAAMPIPYTQKCGTCHDASFIQYQ